MTAPAVSMRLGPLAVLVLVHTTPPLHADPVPADGYSLTVRSIAGAVLAGLSRDGDAVLVTDLFEGRIYRGTRDDAFTAFGPELPHGIDVIGDPTGPYRAERQGTKLLVAQGWTPSDDQESPLDHALLEIDGMDVHVVTSDFWNPYDFVVDGDTIYVVDAARNSIERVTGDGHRSTVFVFARLEGRGSTLEKLSPTEFAANTGFDFDAVPTGIAMRHDRLFVALFAGFPFVAGAGRIVSLPLVETGAGPRVEVDGLDAPVDIAFGPDGHMLLLEHGLFDQAEGFVPGSGRLTAIDRATGKRTVLLDRLTRPAAVLVYDQNTIVISELGERLFFLSRGAGEKGGREP